MTDNSKKQLAADNSKKQVITDNSKKRPRGVVTIGETMGLLTPAAPGPLHRGAGLRLSIAGAESNVAIGVRRLGEPATWIGRVGQDDIGDLVLRELRAEDLTLHAIRDPAPTGLMLKTARAAGVTRVSYYRTGSAGSRLRPGALVEVAGAQAGPGAAIRSAIEVATSNKVLVSLDVNYRSALWGLAEASVVLRDLVRHVDIVFAGEQEAALLAEPGEPAAMARQVAGLGPSQVLIKRGHRGCVAWIDAAAREQPAIPVRAVDPVGAGDAFVAGYLAELLAGQPAEVRLATAAAVGAFTVTVSGDWEGLPTRPDLDLLDAPDDVIR